MATTVSTAVNVSVQPSSLYVGDLHPEVTEAMLFEKFSKVGTVLSIRVCRDAVTRKSLGYAYVNFQQHAAAERAMTTMNYDLLMNKPIRLMWSQRDPSARRSGAGNIFIKNLCKSVDSKMVFDTFSMFGNILSCKVATDLDGNSKGYGFIHFETEEAALKAIEKVNGMLLEDKPVFVGKFIPKAARLRELGERANQFNNIFIKNFGEKLDKMKLETMFEKFGSISSCVVMLDESGKSRGFGFVCYNDPKDAQKAVTEMDGYELPDSDLKLIVCRAQKKSERQAELKRRYEKLKMERQQRYHGVNLYVKKLDENITDETLRQHFESFGTITSVKVMRDEHGISKGFGFVCFEKPDEATKAVIEMNKKILGTKPLYVALAQRKEDRKAQLAAQYMERLLMNQNRVPRALYPSGSSFMPNPQLRNIGNRWTGTSANRYNSIPILQNGYSMQSTSFPRSSIIANARFPGMNQFMQPHRAQLVQMRSNYGFSNDIAHPQMIQHNLPANAAFGKMFPMQSEAQNTQ